MIPLCFFFFFFVFMVGIWWFFFFSYNSFEVSSKSVGEEDFGFLYFWVW